MKRTFFTLNILLFFFSGLLGQLRVHEIFGDGMILQRDVPIKVWGEAAPNTKVKVIFNKKKTKTKADKSGNWLIELPAMPAGGNYDLVVKSKRKEEKFKNIIFGDVWICSGQSNMEWTVDESNNADAEIAKANDKLIRHFKVLHGSSKTPESSIIPGKWEAPTPETVGKFTAVGYYFAKELRAHADVPIGLVNTTWGGSRIETWMSGKGLKYENPVEEVEKLMEAVKAVQKQKIERLKNKFPTVSEEEKGMSGEKAVWAAVDFDDSNWKNIKAPGIWEQQNFDGFDGIAWYRKTFELTPEEAAQNINVALGKIDDSDITFVNGHQVGGLTGQWSAERNYSVNHQYLKPGKNVIAVRVEDTGAGGGIHGDSEMLFVKTIKRTISLAGDWKFSLDRFSFSNDLINPHHVPTLCYNKMIFPINNFSAKGVIWYQGESNAETQRDAKNYKYLFQNMIRQWRADRGDENLPFFFVQLANYLAVPEQPRESNWAVLRESQTAALDLPNTAEAIIIDIGEADDIHPKNKQDVGLRLSLAARNLVYGEKDLIYESPRFKKQEIADNKLILSFENIGEGLRLKGGGDLVKGFAIAGADRKFVWANATLKNNQITVWSDQISKPKYVRFAWAENPGALNLYNSAGLPATPFRTDRRE